MDIQAQVQELEKRVAALEEQLADRTQPERVKPTKVLAPKEILLKHSGLKGHQKTLLLAYYYEHDLGNSSFNVDNIVELFRLAKEKAPTNVNDMINKNIAKGFMMEDSAKKDGKKAWSLTATGETYVQNELEKETSDE